MRIAIDARELDGRSTGVGRYLAHLLTAWEEWPEARRHEYLLYAPGTLEGRLPALPGLDLRVRHVPGDGGSWWEQARLRAALSRDRPAVLFAPAYSAPLATRVPVVLTVHDVSFLAHPEWFPPRVRLRRRFVTRWAAHRARTVLTDSQFSGREITALLGVPPDRVRVIPLAVTSPAAPQGPPPAREPLVLYVGSIFNRRHLPVLVQAVARLAPRYPTLRLAIVGENRTYPPEDLGAVAEKAGIGGRVTLADYVSDPELASLYARARAFAFLSDYEGFGLTPLEALSAGVPVVVGDTDVAREVYGDAARFVPTTEVHAVAVALESVLFDAAARDALLAAAGPVLRRCSWERVGRETLETLLAAAEGGGREG
ncbi:MAG: glycosyltransferase family 1 protein [Acidobacteria bacterium]|nr:MAG: glycosyltransferase family 1 protein [Acidobacteriota bacterium]